MSPTVVCRARLVSKRKPWLNSLILFQQQQQQQQSLTTTTTESTPTDDNVSVPKLLQL